MPAPLVKICCIASAQEAALAIAHGASALGLVSQMPSGPGVIDEARIAAIARTVPSPMETFLLTSLREPSDIAAQHQRCATTTIQLVDHLPPSTHAALRTLLPGVTLVQVVHVVDAESVAYAIDAADGVDALLLDSGNPTLAVRELGGTGRVHDWRLSRAIRDRVPLPVWLAGGLRAHNVQEAIATVQPLGLDLCTGVRTDGWLDEAKLAAFMAAVRG
ncbi:MAG: phosphoribosylanthranilate isomerase [Gemmatimonadaceae bacterium]|jgi:phosphoribosylanthranilate isomerase|nr:phosphoribosylanthranilate isomerase [Gemmatimonadaceae bacterium]